jgi:chloramphenicol-sensitive protein RarD
MHTACMHTTADFKAGTLATAAAFLCWGLFPIFWKLLDGIESIELIAHRIVWCTLFVIGYWAITRSWRFWEGVPWRIVVALGGSAVLIGLNWWLFIWAIGHDRVVESSLGYFINPLVSVVFGMIFLRERLNVYQWGAVSIAAMGVLYLTVQTGVAPWIALGLAFSFGSYGLVRKLVPIDPLRGLAIEGVWLFAPACLYLLSLPGNRLLTDDAQISFLLLCTGPISAIPLLLFAFGARRIPLSLIGILQYIAPTLQCATGVLLYKEPFEFAQQVGFGLIWVALIVYTGNALHRAAVKP